MCCSNTFSLYFHFSFFSVGAVGMFTLNGEEWYEKRKAVAHAFAFKHVKRMANMAIEKTDEWIHSKHDNESFVFDVSNTILDIVLAAIVETAFEYEMSPTEKEVFTHELELAIIEFMAKDPGKGIFFIHRVYKCVQELSHLFCSFYSKSISKYVFFSTP